MTPTRTPARRRLRWLAETVTQRAKDATPGERFIARFDERASVHQLHPRRLGRVVLGLTLFAIGIANAFIPGPGGSVFILGSALVLSGESRTLARLLDWGELRFQRQIRWVIDRPVVAVTTISSGVLVLTTALTLWIA